MEYTLQETLKAYNYLLDEISRAIDPREQINKDNMFYLLGKMHYCLLEERRKLNETLNPGTKPPVKPEWPPRPKDRTGTPA